jgi:hypothetical protein
MLVAHYAVEEWLRRGGATEEEIEANLWALKMLEQHADDNLQTMLLSGTAAAVRGEFVLRPAIRGGRFVSIGVVVRYVQKLGYVPQGIQQAVAQDCRNRRNVVAQKDTARSHVKREKAVEEDKKSRWRDAGEYGEGRWHECDAQADHSESDA